MLSFYSNKTPKESFIAARFSLLIRCFIALITKTLGLTKYCASSFSINILLHISACRVRTTGLVSTVARRFSGVKLSSLLKSKGVSLSLLDDSRVLPQIRLA